VFREPIELGEADKQQRVTLIWGAVGSGFCGFLWSTG
jgi:hypothetical protein